MLSRWCSNSLLPKEIQQGSQKAKRTPDFWRRPGILCLHAGPGPHLRTSLCPLGRNRGLGGVMLNHTAHLSPKMTTSKSQNPKTTETQEEAVVILDQMLRKPKYLHSSMNMIHRNIKRSSCATFRNSPFGTPTRVCCPKGEGSPKEDEGAYGPEG